MVKGAKHVLKAVTFDLWKTVVKQSPGDNIDEIVTAGLEAVLTRHGQTRSRAKIMDATIQCRDKVMGLQVNEGKEMTPQQQLDWIVGLLDIPRMDPLLTELYEAYTTATLKKMPEPVPGVAQVLERLQSQMDLALICNTGKTPGSVARIILERLELKKYFSQLFFSDEVGVAKPHPKIFQETLHALGLKPNQAVHIGDDVRTDVKGARNVGMYTAWLAYGRELDGVECDVVVNQWEDFMVWVGKKAMNKF